MQWNPCHVGNPKFSGSLVEVERNQVKLMNIVFNPGIPNVVFQPVMHIKATKKHSVVFRADLLEVWGAPSLTRTPRGLCGGWADRRPGRDSAGPRVIGVTVSGLSVARYALCSRWHRCACRPGPRAEPRLARSPRLGVHSRADGRTGAGVGSVCLSWGLVCAFPSCFPRAGAGHTASSLPQTDLLPVAQGSASHLPWDGGVFLGLGRGAWGLHGKGAGAGARLGQAPWLAERHPVASRDPGRNRVTPLSDGRSWHRGRMVAGPSL